MDGILLIDKPAGLTSADVVRRVKRRAGVKVGHLGTLDPFATGLLPICLGEGTKIAQFLNTADKAYEGVIQLGWATDTGDSTGARTRVAAAPALDAGALQALAARFTGEQLQTPPMYSALKRDGVPLYRLARRGIEVDREARRVVIGALELAPASSDRLRFRLACSKGTYVRVLAEDIGTALGSAAHLATLRRTSFGAFSIEAAVPLDAWDPASPMGLMTIRQALDHLVPISLPASAAAAARHGKAWVLTQLPPHTGREAVLLDPDGEVVGVVVPSGPGWAYGRVLAGPTFTSDSPYVSTDR